MKRKTSTQVKLTDFYGVGKKTAKILIEKFGSEKRAVEAITKAKIEELEKIGISTKHSLRIIKNAVHAEKLKIFKTKDAKRIYEEILKIISEFAITDATKKRIMLLVPMEKEEIEKSIEDVMKLKEFFMNISKEDVERIKEALKNAKRKEIKPKTTIRYATDDEEMFREISYIARFIEGEGEARNFDVVITRNPERYKNVLTIDFCPDDVIKKAKEEENIYRAMFDIEDVLEKYGKKFFDKEKIRKIVEFLEIFTDSLEIKEGYRKELDLRKEEYKEIEERIDRDIAVLEEKIMQNPSMKNRIIEQFLESYGIFEMPEFYDIYDLKDFVMNEKMKEIAKIEFKIKREIADELRKLDVKSEELYNFELEFALAMFSIRFDLKKQNISSYPCICFKNARSIFLEHMGIDVQPVSYVIGRVPENCKIGAKEDNVVLLTGANSGGKTTLLETILTLVILTKLGLPVPCDSAWIYPFNYIIYHRRHASLRAGALESTLKRIVPSIVEKGEKLVLIDEFEALTEPGAAALILGALINLMLENSCLGVVVTHLSKEVLREAGVKVRVDGIFAKGLDERYNLIVDRQPRFNALGRSTPELIVKKLIAKEKKENVKKAYQIIDNFLGKR